MDWTLPQGVADAALAGRALRAELDGRVAGERLPLFVHGRSFGGGIGAIAAAQLAQLSGGAARVDRLVLELPSLGDWDFRLAHGARAARDGLGADVRQTLVANAQREGELGDRLRLLDAAIHARHVACPALALLAGRDETVPAPTAAAVVNALATEPGLRYRFLTPYGHFDGGLRNARRHAMFAGCRDDFLDPGMPVGDAMARWTPVLERGERVP
jgi:cephalosporin-C deacetylase-like acetyl esterase